MVSSGKAAELVPPKEAMHVDTVSTAAQLDSLVRTAGDTLNIYMLAGDYHLRPKKDSDTAVRVYTEQSIKSVPITYGLKITSKYVRIKGAPAFSSAIYTHAGYGLYFIGVEDGLIEGIIISGGERDSSADAPDAAIVVKNSKLKILNNIIFENIGTDSIMRLTKKGIMGISCREGSNVLIYNNQIARNSWNGIGVFKDATAVITGNLIDGVGKTQDDSVGPGAGIGILITRNGKATLESNVIKRYTKGIGIFCAADVRVNMNLLEDIVTWGIAVWDADTNRPVARIENNVIYKTGACGISITRFLEGGEPGYCRHNIISETAQDHRFDSPDKYCYQCALAVQGRPDKFDVSNNVFYKNTWIAPCFSNLDLSVPEFVQMLQAEFSTLPLQWYAGYSEFIQKYYLYALR
jgi:hypothetical protein